jgi:serine/threonine-protein kinase
VTELVRGIHLREWINLLRDDGELPDWDLVAAVGVEVLRALDAAHSHIDSAGQHAAILHRDVTPTNILLDVSGVVKLADFGLARASDRARMTRPNVVKGKLAYLAPELLLGKPPSVATDLFSLGVVLWEALAGKRLFDAATDLDIVRNVQRLQVPLLGRERQGLPLGVSELVPRALSREPEQRFDSARAMLEALTEMLRVLPHSVDAPALGKSVQRAHALKLRASEVTAQKPA